MGALMDNFEKMSKWYRDFIEKYPDTMLPNILPEIPAEFRNKKKVKRC